MDKDPEYIALSILKDCTARLRARMTEPGFDFAKAFAAEMEHALQVAYQRGWDDATDHAQDLESPDDWNR